MYFIYTLADPRTDKVAYVGMTVNAYERFLAHLRSHGDNRKKDAWIQGLQDEKVIPSMKIIETAATEEEARARENHWIRFYLAQGIEIYNVVYQSPKKKPAPVPKAPKKGVLTTPEVLKRLNISRTTLYSLIERGIIEPRNKRPDYLKRATRLEFRESDVIKLLNGDIPAA